MFQIARFTAIEKPGTSKTSTPVGTSGLALQSLLKRAEVRKREQDEQNGIIKKRPAVADSNIAKDTPKKKKKMPNLAITKKMANPFTHINPHA